MVDYEDFVVREGKADKPIGYSPNPIVRKALENLYISIIGAIDLGDFSTFLKEVADLTYDEAKEKMLKTYGSPKELSQAMLKAKTAEEEGKLQQAYEESIGEQQGLEQQFQELDVIARQRLGEILELSRRNEELEREIKRLKEALAGGEKAATITAAAAHGSMYQEYRKRIGDVISIADVTDLASEIFDIAEHEEYNKLTKSDIAELMEDLRKTGERRAIKLAEMKLEKPKIRGLPELGKEEEIPTRDRKRERREVPAYPIPSGIPQISYKYSTPDTETFTSMGEEFIRDFELERTIKINRLLLFPDHWYTLSPWGKREVYGWDMASAMREAVQHLHKYSWQILIKDYGIPEAYIAAWRAT